MQHEAHVGLVDAHAERRRGDDDVDVARHEALLHVGAVGRLHPRVVGRRLHAVLGHRLGVRLGALAGGRVDDARLGRAHGPQDDRLALLLVVPVALHRQVQVRPVEAAHDLRGVLQVQPLDDLLADRRRGGRREREHGRVAEPLDDVAELEVVGAEVVAPRRQAVRLVDDEQRRLRLGDRVEHLGLAQLLGREEEELDVAVLEPVERLLAVRPGQACCWPPPRPPRRRSPRASRPGRAAAR